MWVFCKNDLVNQKKVGFYAKIDRKFRQTDVNVLTSLNQMIQSLRREILWPKILKLVIDSLPFGVGKS